MNVMLFGASGYLASFVKKELENDGHVVLPIYRNFPESARKEDGLALVSPADARQLISENKPDVVINMANYFSRDESSVDLKRFSEVNSELVAEICLGCRDSGAAMVHVGSAWQSTFGNEDPSLSSLYSLYKGLASKMISWFVDSYSIPAIQVNLFDTYGPGDTRGKIVEFLVNQINSEVPIDLSEGNQILELVHAKDVARAIAMAANLANSKETRKNPQLDKTYWCYPNQSATLREIVSTIDKYAGQPVRVNWGAKPYRVGEQFVRNLSGKETVPGWRETLSLDAGIQDLLQKSAINFE